MSTTKTEDGKIKAELNRLLNERIIIVDGAMGTALEKLTPSVDDFGGEEQAGCFEALNLNAPQLVEDVHAHMRGLLKKENAVIVIRKFPGSIQSLNWQLGFCSC